MTLLWPQTVRALMDHYPDLAALIGRERTDLMRRAFADGEWARVAVTLSRMEEDLLAHAREVGAPILSARLATMLSQHMLFALMLGVWLGQRGLARIKPEEER